MFQTPAEVAKLAADHQVDIVGASSLAGGHLTLLPELGEELRKLGRADTLIVAGGVIPPQDHEAVLKAGAAAIFPPGTVIPNAAESLIDRLNDKG
jgi:methylmalonyl-CoA mutase